MKNIFTYICAAILALGFTSCAKDKISATTETQGMTIIATLDDDACTKTTLIGDDQKGYKVVWEEGDYISVIYNNRACGFSLTSGAGTTTAEFTCSSSLPDGTYDAYFGVDYYKGYQPSLPGNYEPTINRSFTPMKATLTIANGVASVAKFKNLVGLLRLDVTGYGKLRVITVQSDKCISGTFDVDSDGSAIVHNQTHSSTYRYSRRIADEVNLSSNVQSFYIPLPKGDYSSVKISFDGLAGGLCEMTLNEGKTLSIKRSEIYPLSFNANFIAGKLPANGVQGPVKWVQLWENGPKFAEYNIGAANGSPWSQGGWYGYDSPYSTADPATKLWGDSWRTPTTSELKKLVNYGGSYTIAEDVVENGTVIGVKYTGKGIFSKNSIILISDLLYGGKKKDRTYSAIRVPYDVSPLVFRDWDDTAVIRAVVNE